MKIHLVFLCFVLMSVSACATGSVTFTERDRQLPEPSDEVPLILDIYLDREGQLYPLSNTVLPDIGRNGSLQFSARLTGETTLCGASQRSQDKDLGALCDAIDPGLQNADDFAIAASREIAAWDSVQATMWAEVAQAAAKKLRSTEDGDLVILIHGFNVLEGEAFFVRVREYLCRGSFQDNLPEATDGARAEPCGTDMNDEAAVGSNTVFLQVHWNGFRFPGSVFAWGNAQVSGPLVGFSLRSFFSELERELGDHAYPRVRVITHSSGAYVAGAAFGNPSIALPHLSNAQNSVVERNSVGSDLPALRYRSFYAARACERGRWAIPQISDLRIAMFAPATVADTFSTASEPDAAYELSGASSCPEPSSTSPVESSARVAPEIPEFPPQGRVGLLVENAVIMSSLRSGDYALIIGVISGNFSNVRNGAGLGPGPSSLGHQARQACNFVNGRTDENQHYAVHFGLEGGSLLDSFDHASTSYLTHTAGRAMLDALYAEEQGAPDAPLVPCLSLN